VDSDSARTSDSDGGRDLKAAIKSWETYQTPFQARQHEITGASDPTLGKLYKGVRPPNRRFMGELETRNKVTPQEADPVVVHTQQELNNFSNYSSNECAAYAIDLNFKKSLR
jgi:hypothetical protein